METVICLHVEIIDSSTHLGKCRICGQERFYDPLTPGKNIVTKRGSIDGKLTEVTPPKKRRKGAGESSPTSSKPPEDTQDTPSSKKRGRFFKRRPLSYWKRNREELTADYRSMTLKDFFEKWHISSSTWIKIRDRLGIPKNSMLPKEKSPKKIIGRAETVVEAKRVTKQPDSEPFQTGPLNKREGVRAIWRF
ncbi:hypothetical protein LCGC14_0732890 [marine sediment metagenome]|uniref:Uncharacterized protein n=1 Tax=marine sediment metagenome TaxID=412755 RepID=A0A0F9Q938_9ZZZZ|nr:hypothetical protein [Candidatus Aminicenantes bacterium]